MYNFVINTDLSLPPRPSVALPGLGVLQQVRVPIISSPSCQQLFDVNPGAPEDHVEILPDELCAGYPEGGRDACQVGTCLSVGVSCLSLGLLCLSL